MIIRSASGLPLDFSQDLNRLRARTLWWCLLVAFAISSLPGISLAQITPGSAASQPSSSTTALPPAVSAPTSNIGVSAPAGYILSPNPPAVSAPTSNIGVSAPAGYILSPNDQIAVEVFGEDDLRANGRLNGEGNLSVPLLGSIHLAGLTLTQAASKLTGLYAHDYLVNPRVNVMLVGYAKRRFSVLGQVNRPGSYEMPDGSPGGIDLLEARKFLRPRLSERPARV